MKKVIYDISTAQGQQGIVTLEEFTSLRSVVEVVGEATILALVNDVIARNAMTKAREKLRKWTHRNDGNLRTRFNTPANWKRETPDEA